MRKFHARTALDEIVIREGLEGLTPAQILTLYRRAPLLRPVKSTDRIWEMYQQSSLVLSAWHAQHFVGIARVLTDGVVHSFLCDLAVEPDVQGLGVGRRLVQEVMKRCKGTTLMLRGSRISAEYYAKVGFEHVHNAWVWKG